MVDNKSNLSLKPKVHITVVKQEISTHQLSIIFLIGRNPSSLEKQQKMAFKCVKTSEGIYSKSFRHFRILGKVQFRLNI